MPQQNKIYIPTFISSVNYQPARVLPHVYFYNGTKSTNSYYIQGYNSPSTSSVVASEFTEFPYFDNYSGNTPTSSSLSLLFNNEPAVYGDTPTGSLYSTYWSRYVDLLYSPKTRVMNCSAIIPLADYFDLELNDIVQFRGNYWHLRAINNYSLKTGECDLQLLGPILNDIITSINPELSCDFDYDIDAAIFTTTTTSTTTTIAPTTTTTSTTTAAPTTTTTTTLPYNPCDCNNVTFYNNNSRLAAALTYTPCGTSTSIQVFVPARSNQTYCLATNAGFSYPGGTDFYYVVGGTCIVDACTTTTTTTGAPTTTSTSTTTTAAPTTTSTTTTSTSTTTTAAPTTTTTSTTTTAAPTTTTTSTSTTSTTTAAPVPPLQTYKYTGNQNPSVNVGTFVDFYGITRDITAYTIGTDYKFVALSGSVSITGGGALTILEASSSFPTFSNVTVTKTPSNGLTAYTFQNGEGNIEFIAESPGGWTRNYCLVTNTAQETYDPLNKLTITQGSLCSATTTTTSTTSTSTTSTSTTTTSTTTTIAPTTTTTSTTTTLPPRKYYMESCVGPGDVSGVFTILNAPLFSAGETIHIAGGIGGYYCFQIFSTSTATSLGTYSVDGTYGPAACGSCPES